VDSWTSNSPLTKGPAAKAVDVIRSRRTDRIVLMANITTSLG